MNDTNLQFIFFAVIVVCVFYILYNVSKYVEKFKELDISKFSNSWFDVESSKATVKDDDKDLLKFSADVSYEHLNYEFEQHEHAYKCTIEEPRLCDTTDASTCFGCSNLVARCIHLSEDIQYNDNGTVTTLKKNKTPTEGYCLALDKVSSVCNPIHGKLTLVVSEDQSLKRDIYNLICLCINPGYIGNNTIMDACETPFICNGKVKDINVPLAEVQCDCDSGMRSELVNGTPTCQPYTVKDAHDISESTLSITVPVSTHMINSTISGNYPFNIIQSPCAVCPITGKYTGGKLVDANGNVQCVSGDPSFGVPVRRSPSFRLLRGNEGPDAILAIRNFEISVYGYLQDSTYPTLGVAFNRAGNEQIFDLIPGDANEKKILIIEPWNQTKFPGNFTLTSLDVAPNIQLVTIDFRYHDYFQNPAQTSTETSNWQNINTYLNSKFIENILVYGQEQLPGKFIWKRGSWEVCQLQMKPMVKFKYINTLPVVMHNKNLMNETAEAKYFCFLYMTYDLTNKKYWSNSARSVGDYEKVKEALISLGD